MYTFTYENVCHLYLQAKKCLQFPLLSFFSPFSKAFLDNFTEPEEVMQDMDLDADNKFNILEANAINQRLAKQQSFALVSVIPMKSLLMFYSFLIIWKNH